MIVRPETHQFESATGIVLDAHVFKPTSEPAATVAFFHPGGFTMGDPTWGYRFAEAHLERSHAFVSLSYRHLAGKLTIDDLLDDAEAGLDWVAGNVAGTSPVFSSGHSAGGYLAMVPVLREISTAVAGMSLLAPVPRIGSSLQDRLPEGADPAQFDPAHVVSARPVPAVFVHGRLDDLVPVEGSARLDQAWRDVGCRSKLVAIEGADHFFNHPILGDQAHEQLAEAIGWLAG